MEDARTGSKVRQTKKPHKTKSNGDCTEQQHTIPSILHSLLYCLFPPYPRPSPQHPKTMRCLNSGPLLIGSSLPLPQSTKIPQIQRSVLFGCFHIFESFLSKSHSSSCIPLSIISLLSSYRCKLSRVFRLNGRMHYKSKTLSKEKFQTNISIMSIRQTQNLKRQCILSPNASLNNFIFNIAHIKRPYNEQIKKRCFTPKTNTKASNHTQSTLEKESSPLFILKFQESPSPPLHSQFKINCIQQYILGTANKHQRKRYVYNIYRGVIYSQLKLKQPSEEFVRSRTIYLSEPTVSHRKFLLLDLDETLMHAQRWGEEEGKASYRFTYRPHLFAFLERMSELFEIYVFTAAQKSYAEAVVRKLNRAKVYIKDVLHRQHCLETRKGRFLKDLRIIGNRGLEDIVLVDNLVESFGLQLNNGVPIHEFKGGEDSELLKIMPLMERISNAEDVRCVLRQTFRLEEVGRLDRREVKAYFCTN